MAEISDNISGKIKPLRRKKKKKPFGKTLLKNLFLGIIRGIGMALGFSGIAVVLIFIARFIPITEIPLIGDIIKAIINSGNK